MNTTRDKSSRLGRGFSALLPTAPAPGAPTPATASPATTPAESATRGGPVVLSLAIEALAPDRRQPRRNFDEAELAGLAASIREKGVILPILARRDGEQYRIIAGERRWRAAQRAGLQQVPVLVREVTERQAFELALIENLQRHDLNPIEEAEGYRRLIEEHALTQEACAERVGKDRTVITNALRLLRLPEEVKGHLVDGSLGMGHARALLGLADDAAIRRAAKDVLGKHLSVRQTEALVRKLKSGGGPAGEAKAAERSPQVRALEDQLQRALGTKVRLEDRGGGTGRLEIEFFSHEEFERLLARLLGSRPG